MKKLKLNILNTLKLKLPVEWIAKTKTKQFYCKRFTLNYVIIN